jgi:hypothetical protein
MCRVETDMEFYCLCWEDFQFDNFERFKEKVKSYEDDGDESVVSLNSTLNDSGVCVDDAQVYLLIDVVP